MPIELAGSTGITTPGMESTGMPTVGGDAVVESGSNSDGEWTRWADGTQLVRSMTAADSMDVNDAHGSIYRSTSVSLNYPQPFTVALGSYASDTTSSNVWAGARSGTTVATLTLFYSVSITGRTGVISTTGRWK